MLAVNIQTFFKRTPAFIVFGFDLQGCRQKKPFQALGTGIKIPSVASLSQILHFKICISRKNTGTYFLLVYLKSQRMKTQHTFLSEI